MPRVRFAPSHVTRERLAPNVIQPVVAITTRPVTQRLARVFVQQGTSARSRSLWTAFLYIYTVHGILWYNTLLTILVERKWSCTFSNYLFSLYRCTEECPVGFYGEFCSKECNCENGGTCDHVTGTCRCVPGFVGPTCAIRGQCELSWR